MLWKRILNTEFRTWNLPKAVDMARELGYPMMIWNGSIYPVPPSGEPDLNRPLFNQDEVK